MTSSRNFSPARRTLSFALFFAAVALTATVFTPVSSLLAIGAKDSAGNIGSASTPIANEPADVAAFREAAGGSITPLIVELKRDPAVLHRRAEEQAGRSMSEEDLLAYMRELLVEQNDFLAQLGSRGVRALLRQADVTQLDGAARPIQYRFAYLLNGFVAYVANDDIEKLKGLPEVAHVSEPIQARFNLDRAIDYSLGTQQNPADRRTAVYGANQEFQPAGSPGHPETPATTKLDGFEGQNINVAVIDSGVDFRHPMFGGIGQTTPLPRVSGRPEGADDNKKVIYFYTFNEPVGDPTDDFGHGTLVASCSSGYSVDGNTPPRMGYGTGVDGRGVGPTPNGTQLFGTAPQSRIMAYKVCGPALACAGDIELSIEDAASPVTLVGATSTGIPTMVPKPVADVINLSLGDSDPQGGGGDPTEPSARASNNAALAGTIVVASAGNDGANPMGAGTIGAPSAATLAISVAASLDPNSVGGSDVLAAGEIPLETRTPATPGPSPEVGGASNANAPQPDERQGIRIFPVAGGGPLPADRQPAQPVENNTGSLSAHYVFVERRVRGMPAPPIPTSVGNRIAVVKFTGTFAIAANELAAQPVPPAAILLITTFEAATAVQVIRGIPTFAISLADGNYLIDRLLSGDPGDGDNNVDVPSGTISELPLRLADTFSLATFPGFMAGFSSRGPNDNANANFRTIKPDVTGPGVGIVGAATVEGLPDDTVGLASTTGYTIANGTSFSGPITAGAMALLRQRVREELNLDTTDVGDPNYNAKRFDTVTVARALLQNSATNLRSGLGQPQGNGPATASILDMGSGHINVAAALRAKAIMVSPTLLFRDPAEFGGRPVPLMPSQDPPIDVLIPTASFGAVPVVGLNGNLERRKEVIIRDVTNGEGGRTYQLSAQNNRLANRPGFQVSFVNGAGVPINSVTVPDRGQRSFFVRVVADGRQVMDDPTEFQFYVTATDSAGDTLRMPFYYRAVAAGPNAVPTVAAQLQNISTRVNVQTGNDVGIAGIIITGDESKRVALRGIGPSLTADRQPLNGRLQDTVLELFDSNGVFIEANDNWKDSDQEDIEESGFAPPDDRESVILRRLAPGNYTAVLSGKDNSTGIGLVEAYDRDQAGAERFANISTRGRVETGDNVLIGGFIAGRQDGPTNIVVRALGPSLVTRGVPLALQDPTVQLVNANGEVINENDDFATSPQLAEIEARGLAPSDPRESALFQVVNPGDYTAVVRGKLDTTGVGLVEVYNVQ